MYFATLGDLEKVIKEAKAKGLTDADKVSCCGGEGFYVAAFGGDNPRLVIDCEPLKKAN